VVAAQGHDAPVRCRSGHSEGIAVPLYHEHGKLDRVQLVLAAPVRATGSVDRKREAELLEAWKARV